MRAKKTPTRKIKGAYSEASIKLKETRSLLFLEILKPSEIKPKLLAPRSTQVMTSERVNLLYDDLCNKYIHILNEYKIITQEINIKNLQIVYDEINYETIPVHMNNALEKLVA